MRQPYMPLFVRDFCSDPVVIGMRWLNQAIYLRMLMASWEAGPLPLEPLVLKRLVDEPNLQRDLEDFGADFSIDAAIEEVLALCWQETSNGWINPRLERERKHAIELEKKRSDSASKANSVRWGSESDPSRTANGSAADPKRIPSQDQDQSKNKNPPYPPAEAGASPPPASPAPASPREEIHPKKRTRVRPPVWTGTVRAPWLADPWAKWVAYRRDEKRKPVTQISGDTAIEELILMGEARAKKAIDFSIANGWQGIFEPKPNADSKGIAQHFKAVDNCVGPSCATCGARTSGKDGKCPACGRPFVDGTLHG